MTDFVVDKLGKYRLRNGDVVEVDNISRPHSIYKIGGPYDR